jgi:hypothetical protein
MNERRHENWQTFLKQELDTLCTGDALFCNEEGDNSGTYRVSLPPLPPDYESSDDEFAGLLVCSLDDEFCLNGNRWIRQQYTLGATQ